MESTSTYRDLQNSDFDEGQGMVRTATEEAGEAVQDVHARFTSAMESARKTYTKLRAKGGECAKATDHIVRKHPYPSLGLVFSAGLVIGLLCHRKS